MGKCEDCIHRFVCETLRGRIENTWAETCVAYRHKRSCAEVVFCKECKHWKPGDSFSGDSLDDMQRIGGCPIVRFGRRENDFCCEGERKDNA